mmetsp:Transcript_15535/g.22936  ORF Transcript_15535/g.22936 Transcript_15535/m.22936 type:complete len:173 (+) Transcript_15535:1077-1595(+)
MKEMLLLLRRLIKHFTATMNKMKIGTSLLLCNLLETEICREIYAIRAVYFIIAINTGNLHYHSRTTINTSQNKIIINSSMVEITMINYNMAYDNTNILPGSIMQSNETNWLVIRIFHHFLISEDSSDEYMTPKMCMHTLFARSLPHDPACFSRSNISKCQIGAKKFHREITS